MSRKSSFNPAVLAANLRACRARLDLTQEQVSQDTGLSLASIKNYESGDNVPGTDAICVLADYYRTSVDRLCGRKSHAA